MKRSELTTACQASHRYLVQKTTECIKSAALFLDRLYFPDDHDQLMEAIRKPQKPRHKSFH